VLTALEKLPADRFATAGAFSAALTAAPAASHATVATAAAAKGRSAPRGRWPLVAGALAALSLLLAGALVITSRRTSEPRVVRAALQVDTRSGPYSEVVAGSPDGRSYVYCTSAGLVELRRWDELAASSIPGLSTGCAAAAYSPDGKSLAIVGIPSALYIVPLEGGGLPRRLTVDGMDDVAIYGGQLDWASDGQLYLAGRPGLLRIAPATGRVERVKIADTSAVLIDVDVLPGATRAVVVTTTAAATDHAVGFLDLGTGSITPVGEGVLGRFVDDGHLLVVREDGSMAGVPFDPRDGKVTGPAVPLPDSLGPLTFGPGEQARMHVGADGTLLYWRTEQGGETRPVLVNRQGVERPMPESWAGRHLIPRFSPDGSRFSLEVFAQDSRTVVRTIATGATRTAGTPGALTGRASWVPDGSELTVISDRDGLARPYAWRLSGDVIAPLPLYDPRPVYATEWSRDGRWLLLRTDDQAPGKADILAVRPGVDSVARPLLALPDVAEYSPMLSPDGRWLAYVSNEDGRYEVRVTSFPEVQERWRISSAGGSEPGWSHDGRELFYIADDGYLMSATVAPGAEFAVSSQQRLFSMAPYARYGFFNRNYDVARDGTFLMLRLTGASTSRLVAVHGWAAALRARTGR
jgi:serine/threonine-protein kinase